MSATPWYRRGLYGERRVIYINALRGNRGRQELGVRVPEITSFCYYV